jgi:hypothetical protein
VYDRAYLLSAAKRDDVVNLDEVVRYGRDSYGDPDYVSLYGMTPPEWYARGVRLLARTVVECTRDVLAQRIAADVAAAARGGRDVVVVDPFAGSANTLYWLARRLGARRACGFELHPGVFAATRANLRIVGCDAELAMVDFDAGLRALRLADGERLVVFVAPPWGDALDPVAGLDLRRTQPPVIEIVDLLARTFPEVLVAVQIHERARPDSLAELRARCAWSAVEIYDVNAPGQRHGVLLGRLG